MIQSQVFTSYYSLYDFFHNYSYSYSRSLDIYSFTAIQLQVQPHLPASSTHACMYVCVGDTHGIGLRTLTTEQRLQKKSSVQSHNQRVKRKVKGCPWFYYIILCFMCMIWFPFQSVYFYGSIFHTPCTMYRVLQWVHITYGSY